MPDGFTLITGASSGIGSAVALRLAADRALLLHGRDRGRLEQVRAQCAHPERHRLWYAELTEVEAAGESLATLLVEQRIAVTAFVHSAGVNVILPVRALDARRVQKTMDVNFAAALQIVHVLMKKRVNAEALRAVVFVSSIASRLGVPGFAAYSASKGALNACMRSLAVELAPHVRVNSLLPGPLRTPGAEQLFANPGFFERLATEYPLGAGALDDVAAAVEYLLGDGGRWITGQEFVVDGGGLAAGTSPKLYS